MSSKRSLRSELPRWRISRIRGEEEAEGFIAGRQFILRPEHGPTKLTPLELDPRGPNAH